MKNEVVLSTKWHDRELTIKTGKLAKQANSAVTVQYGDTVVLATVVESKQEREGIDFFPLMVDFEERFYAAGIIKGKKVAIRTIIVPATPEIWKQAIDEGLAEIFYDAACVFSAPTCGACLGGFMGILAEGERCISTTNRNFVGRMGHPKSEVYLASPATAAASAIEGKLADPRKYL